MSTKVTSLDLRLARELRDMSGPKAPAPQSGPYYWKRMAAIIARIRKTERKSTERRLSVTRKDKPCFDAFTLLAAYDVLREAVGHEVLGHSKDDCLCRLCVALRDQRLERAGVK